MSICKEYKSKGEKLTWFEGEHQIEAIKEVNTDGHQSRKSESKNGILEKFLNSFSFVSANIHWIFWSAERIKEIVAHDWHPAEHGDAEVVDEVANDFAAFGRNNE